MLDRAILDAWEWPSPIRLEPILSGLINRTWAVWGGAEPISVLQQLNTQIFKPELHEDIEAVTRHLERRGISTPCLVRTRQNELWHTAPDGTIWRQLTWVGDRTIERLTEPADARSAGALIAAFHEALADLDWEFRFVRGGFHDTPLRMERLRSAVATFPDHRLYESIAPLADAIFTSWSEWSGPVDLPERIVHGDLKISNIRFQGQSALAVIDLDTLAHGTLDAELGDALRSWCNPASEDSASPRFDLALFEAALEGYARAGSSVAPAEWDSIVPGVERISLELAARFAADALEECYFGFNPRFGTRGDHNLLRATGQLALARSARAVGAEAEAIVSRLRATS